MQETEIKLHGLRFQVCQWGITGNPTIVILHGWVDQAFAWEPVAEKLSRQGFRVIAFDQRGYGRTQHIPQCSHYYFPDYIIDLDALQKELSLSRFTLIGHSMGGTVASQYAAICPDNLDNLILIEGIGIQHENEKNAFNRYKTHVQQRREKKTHTPFTSIEAGVQRIRTVHPYIDENWARKLVMRTTNKVEEGYIWSWDSRHRERSAIGFDRNRYLFLLTQITAPTYVILANQSWYQRLSDLDTRIDALPNLKRRLTISGGHSQHYENPTRLSHIILDCLQHE